ncbi:autophagy-related protein 16-1 [Synchiropus splendidus]|uniref:autophagy-related protein 16-1 n=1 Tax=Synchiropus splendidus TaxID=270530 RepID=UPI00237EB2BA|nr:autophagy-related protein 16-1 [Synchiropus splendidus]
MQSWKSHVAASLQRRDRAEKLPFIGVFTSLSQLEERFDARTQFLEETSERLPDQCGVGNEVRLLQLQLRESEHLAEKLSQTVSDLTTVLHLKDAEVQHWHSSVARQRQEVLTLAKGSKALRTKLWDHEYTIECQSKELTALQKEQAALQEALTQGRREKEELLQRWMAEKMQEADRLNKYNDAQERWQRLAQHLKKNVRKEMEKSSCAAETSAASRMTAASEVYQGHDCQSATKV